MVINFRVCGISWGTHKVTRTSTLIKKKKQKKKKKKRKHKYTPTVFISKGKLLIKKMRLTGPPFSCQVVFKVKPRLRGLLREVVKKKKIKFFFKWIKIFIFYFLNFIYDINTYTNEEIFWDWVSWTKKCNRCDVWW